MPRSGPILLSNSEAKPGRQFSQPRDHFLAHLLERPTEIGKKVCKSCLAAPRQGRAEQLRKSRNKFLATTYKHFSRSLYITVASDPISQKLFQTFLQYNSMYSLSAISCLPIISPAQMYLALNYRWTNPLMNAVRRNGFTAAGGRCDVLFKFLPLQLCIGPFVTGWLKISIFRCKIICSVGKKSTRRLREFHF